MAYLNSDPLIRHAIRIIKEQYGVDVSVDAKDKDLLKFGRNPNVGTATTGYTLWSNGVDQAHETYVAANTNSIDSVSSTNAGDTQQVVIEGHTESGGNKTFVSQTATLNGQTRVALSTALNRSTRIYNNGTTDLAGAVYVYENTALTSGKPTDTTKIHVSIPSGKNQSQKASTSLSSTDYWIVTQINCHVLTKTAAYADVELQVRLNGKVFRTLDLMSASNATGGIITFNPYVIIPANSDVRLVAVGSTSGLDVSGNIHGYLALVI